MSAADLLALFDAEIRATEADRIPSGLEHQTDGPVLRAMGERRGFATLVADAGGLAAAELAAVVDGTFAFFAERGLGFEWKTYDHDPPGLVPLLVAAGAVPEPRETLLLGEAGPLAQADPGLSGDLRLREVTARRDLESIGRMEDEVWGDGSRGWLADDLERRLAGPGGLRIYVVEDAARDLVVSAAWLEPVLGTRAAGLWGGSTLAAYRGRGCYRALVAARARAALEMGHDLLQVDATEDSRPILERLGLVAVGGTTPYVAASPG